MTLSRLLSFTTILYALAAAPAIAQMDYDAPPPATPAANPDAGFVAYAQKSIAFTHAEVIDGTGAAPQYDETVIVKDGRIAAVGPAAKVHTPRGATIIDMHGKTLLPGFVMVHEHLFYPMGNANYAALLYSFPRLYLAGGTTTARTAGSMSPYGDLNLKIAIDKGEAIGPDLDVTAPYLQGKPGLPILSMHLLASPDDATRTTNYWLDEGATSLKAYMHLSRAELKAIIDVAHARGVKVTGHLCSITYREAADLGIDNLEHGFAASTDFVPGKKPDECPLTGIQSFADLDVNSPPVKSLIDDLIAHHIPLTSTLTVFETFTPGRPKAPDAALQMLIPQLRQEYEANWTAIQTGDRMKPYTKIFPTLMKLEKMYADAGGTLLAGTDPTGYGGVIPGFSGKREIELLIEAGFTFPEALKIATLNGAKFLGRDGDVGSIASGKRADLVVIDGDPMKSPSAIEQMPYVFKNGVGYDSAAIFAALKGVVGLY